MKPASPTMRGERRTESARISSFFTRYEMRFTNDE